jgi:hypothetical protein
VPFVSASSPDPKDQTYSQFDGWSSDGKVAFFARGKVDEDGRATFREPWTHDFDTGREGNPTNGFCQKNQLLCIHMARWPPGFVTFRGGSYDRAATVYKVALNPPGQTPETFADFGPYNGHLHDIAISPDYKYVAARIQGTGLPVGPD